MINKNTKTTIPIGNAIYHCAERYVVAIVSSESARKIFQVFFSSDGSLHVTFPYFSFKEGLLSIATIPANSKYPMDLELEPGGKVTKHLVKYSHHPDGQAHFSQDGKIYTTIKKKSVPLTQCSGHIFTVTIWNIDFFDRIEREEFLKSTNKRKIISFEISHKPNAIKFVGMWYSIKEINSRITGKMTSEVCNLTSPEGKLYQGYLLSNPFLANGNRFVLAIFAEELNSEDKDPALTFIGGFDPIEVTHKNSIDTTFLSLVYPVLNVEELAKKIGSVDFIQEKY